jgi:hypothetical protein
MEYNFNKAWLLALEERFGMTASELREVKLEGRPRILVYYFANFPEAGMLTAITCGLSNASHPDWKFGKPELMVTLDTTDYQWGKAAAYFALAHYGDKAFSYGESFKLDFPMAGDSTMNAAFLYKPSFLDAEQAKFVLQDRVVHLAGMYPMYDEEVKVFETIGLEAFWNAPGFDYYNARRPLVSA